MKKEKEKLIFVIVSPPQKSGGSIVLHNLNKLLNELGHQSKIFYMGYYDYINCNKINNYILHCKYIFKMYCIIHIYHLL